VEFVAEQKSAMVEKRRQSIYNTWLNLLTAKTELERKRRKRIEYSKLEPSGSAINSFFNRVLILPAWTIRMSALSWAED